MKLSAIVLDSFEHSSGPFGKIRRIGLAVEETGLRLNSVHVLNQNVGMQSRVGNPIDPGFSQALACQSCDFPRHRLVARDGFLREHLISRYGLKFHNSPRHPLYRLRKHIICPCPTEAALRWDVCGNWKYSRDRAGPFAIKKRKSEAFVVNDESLVLTDPECISKNALLCL